MPRKQSRQQAQPSLPIAKLDNVPGPEADEAALKAHYDLVQEIMAIHRYDDVINACHWCCDMEAGLAYTKPDEKRGSRMFCSGRCASAFSAYQVKVLHLNRKPTVTQAQPSDSDETVDDSYSPPPDTEGAKTAKTQWKPTSERPRRQRRVKDVTEVVGQEGTGKTTGGPKRTRAAKPKRTDGKCTKGLHEMTEANTYSYNGGTWCRECRKASRTKSKNGNGKA